VLNIWLTWGLLVAVQSTSEAVGQLDLPSPYGGEMYGERAAFAVACLAFVFFVWGAFAKTRVRAIGFTAAFSALLATPELGRTSYPAVMGWAQLMMAFQLLLWWDGFSGAHERRMAAVALLMQSLAFAIFVNAQIAIGLMPAPAGEAGSALFFLGVGWLHMAWVVVGTSLLSAATLWKRG
jgi:hypothetical protein